MFVQFNDEIITRTDVIDYAYNRITENEGIMTNVQLPKEDLTWSLRTRIGTSFDMMKLKEFGPNSKIFMASDETVLPVLINKTDTCKIYANVPFDTSEIITLSMEKCE